ARAKPRQATPSLSKQRLRLWIRILRAARAIEAEVRERLRVQFDVTLPQFDVMAALERKPDSMTMTELSRFLMVSNGNVNGIIVRLTPRGLKEFTAMAKAHESWVDGLLSEFDAMEAATLIRHLDGLSGRIR